MNEVELFLDPRDSFFGVKGVMDMNITAEQIKTIACQLGADLCGIASIERFGEAPQGFHPSDVLADCQSVIVLGRRFLKSTLHASSTIPYTTVRNELSTQLNIMGIKLAEILEDLDITAVPANTIGPDEYDANTNRFRGIISLKHAAVNAGLGKIGKNTLLVNHKYGNMVWINAVLVSARLEADPPAEYEVCNPACNLCLESCPAGALQENFVDQRACWQHAYGEHNGGEWRIKCYACRKVCPNCTGVAG